MISNFLSFAKPATVVALLAGTLAMSPAFGQ
jgi:hypothetical protein